MHLNNDELSKSELWAKADIKLPEFDRKAMIETTLTSPVWIHFGAGNIFRAFPAVLQQCLLDAGSASSGIIVAEGYDTEIIDRMYHPYDNLSLLVTLKSDGSIAKTVIGSIAEALKIDSYDSSDCQRMKEIFRSPGLQIASFTITEKGYSLVNGKGEMFPDVLKDLVVGPSNPKSYIGKITALLVERYNHGKHPLALVSLDNCSHNGTMLHRAIQPFAEKWAELGLVEKGFVDYIDDPKSVSFTWSMIDKITPRPDESVRKMLLDVGFEDTESIVTKKNTYIAPFVNAEECQYLIIEDNFPNGRPA
ncbi:MAG: mannitol dehydrogenase family protein, partial [Erysipelotrichaceae bacterium]